MKMMKKDESNMKTICFILFILGGLSLLLHSYSFLKWDKKIKEKKDKEFKLDSENYYKYFLSDNMEEDNNEAIVYAILYFFIAIFVILLAFYSIS